LSYTASRWYRTGRTCQMSWRKARRT